MPISFTRIAWFAVTRGRIRGEWSSRTGKLVANCDVVDLGLVLTREGWTPDGGRELERLNYLRETIDGLNTGLETVYRFLNIRSRDQKGLNAPCLRKVDLF